MEGVYRILSRFAAATMFISVFLLMVNFVLLGTLVFKEAEGNASPEGVVRQVAEGLKPQPGGGYVLDVQAAGQLRQSQAWAMLLDESGRVVWDDERPAEVPQSYTLTEVAKFSRYYIKEYPVYIWELDHRLLVVGYPKQSHWKYQFSFLSEWVKELPTRLVILLIFNGVLALVISAVIGARLIRSIRPLLQGVHNLAREQTVQLDAKGLFGSLAASINEASAKLAQKNAALKARDEARSNWIAGISHDIRTPLSMILGYASDMEEHPEIPAEQRQQAGIIRRQGEKLRSLVSDLNLVSMLEYEMQPLHKKELRLSVLARQAAADTLNNGLDERYAIELHLDNEPVKIRGDEKLLLRAIGNLVNNSVRHNPEGCRITLETTLAEDRYCLTVKDDGQGIPPERLAEITELPYSAKRTRPVHQGQGHGLGLPMVARITEAHGGTLVVKNNGEGKGLTVTMSFPLLSDSVGGQ
ncbi:sensor histidine kinase [Paenibacillus sp. CN-4]|uniref:sensor histidine kinase n=1 Tax=Paenibacillus nanchangensis TaxID=3348343 RepID=UPI00397A347E